MALHPVVEQVTDRIIERSRPSRAAYLAHLDAARIAGVQRGALSCTNLAHGFAAFPANDKLKLREPNAAVGRHRLVLQRHAVGAPAVRALPGRSSSRRRAKPARVAQFAGGVPAMCDGVTQGQPGMELSLFSRDVIAMAHGGRADAQHVRRRRCASASATRSCRAC